MRNLFATSKVGLICGSAGTGKSTMIKHLSNFYRDEEKIYLANTHAAVENLKRNIGKSETSRFCTIKRFTNEKFLKHCKVLFIDECSTVSNADMTEILKLTEFELLVLVGDIYQIESIKFGNWFYIAKTILPYRTVFELDYVYRSADPDLCRLWESVRSLDDKMSDLMELNHFCSAMDETIFEKMEDDEIVLCLNYDGLYGINNINQFLQANNSGKSVQLGIEQYKVGDPIIFKETERFGDYLFNNLKGRIITIDEDRYDVTFTAEVDTYIDSSNLKDAPFTLKPSENPDKSVVSFKIRKFRNTDDEDRGDEHVVPFNVAYAVSIHKAQGLEYDSVKIIITDDMEDLVTHNIFYTAITRAKKKLRIYWTRSAEQTVLDNMHLMFNKRDASILSEKFYLGKK